MNPICHNIIISSSISSSCISISCNIRFIISVSGDSLVSLFDDKSVFLGHLIPKSFLQDCSSSSTIDWRGVVVVVAAAAAAAAGFQENISQLTRDICCECHIFYEKSGKLEWNTDCLRIK